MNEVIELRQYTLKPGTRDTLIELFEREFVETQEELGMDVIGTFHDAGDPDRFVWLRGYANMETRRRALNTFYAGPVWKAHRDAAVATMVDTDDVLLLRPAWRGSGFDLGGARAPAGASELPGDFVVGTIAHFDEAVPDGFVASFHKLMPSLFEVAGAMLIAALLTEQSANNYPAHPVREGEHVFAWFLHFAEGKTARSVPLPPELDRYLHRPTETLGLRPTARSRRLDRPLQT